MLRVTFAIVVAAVAYTAVSETTKAAPIAQLPAGVSTDATDVTPVYYYHGHHYRYHWHGHYYHHRHWRYHRWYYY
jgi:hypothetical protein